MRDRHRRRAAWAQTVIGPSERGPVVELGAGGGQDAIALAELGYEVWAVEQEPILVAHIRALSHQHPAARLKIIEANSYHVDLPPHRFAALLYWDDFGVGGDEEQRYLLRRIRTWLQPEGVALIDIYTPWHAARSIGKGWRVGRATREYGFDGDRCRRIDRWWVEGEEPVEQSLRCYAPADLRLLLQGTGLTLTGIKVGGMMDYASGCYFEAVPLEQAMVYTAILKPLVAARDFCGGR